MDYQECLKEIKEKKDIRLNQFNNTTDNDISEFIILDLKHLENMENWLINKIKERSIGSKFKVYVDVDN